MRGEGREGGQGRQGPPRRHVNKKTEHKIFALYLGVRGPGQRDTSRGPQAGARTREISTRLRKPPQRTAHPMTNRPQLITQGCLRRVAPGPAPKKTFDNVCVWLGVGVHSRVVSERTPNRKQHMSRQQHTQGLLDLGAAGKTTKRDNRKTTDHLIALRSVSHGTSFKKCAFLSEASSRLPGGHREPPSSPPGVSTHSTRRPSSPPGVSTHSTRLRSRPRLWRSHPTEELGRPWLCACLCLRGGRDAWLLALARCLQHARPANVARWSAGALDEQTPAVTTLGCLARQGFPR